MHHNQLIKAPKIGRNKECFCGSGIKFKYCCLKKIRAQEKLKYKG